MSSAHGKTSTQFSAIYPLKILVADDLDINREFLRRFLRHLGYQATLVANGQEAVTAVRENNFELILMDLEMPIMDGYEATRQIRQLPGPLPFIAALTCVAINNPCEFCRSTGIDSYVPKPISLEGLKGIIRDAAGRQATGEVKLSCSDALESVSDAKRRLG